LSKINLLLIDEVHMLNFEERGATLEAVISRIMSISNPRVIAVSATIPNIKEVAQWLKVSTDMTFVFGDEYRPVKINKVVLGFKSSNNPYTFEKILNYKLT
jgi:ATP-dependent DNA helicase HFM1/MER3